MVNQLRRDRTREISGDADGGGIVLVGRCLGLHVGGSVNGAAVGIKDGETVVETGRVAADVLPQPGLKGGDREEQESESRER